MKKAFCVIILTMGMVSACVLATGDALEVSSLAYAQQTASPAFAPDQFRLIK